MISLISALVTPLSSARSRWPTSCFSRPSAISVATTIRLRSRFDRPGRSHTSPNRTFSLYLIRSGTTLRTRSRAEVGCDWAMISSGSRVGKESRHGSTRCRAIAKTRSAIRSGSAEKFGGKQDAGRHHDHAAQPDGQALFEFAQLRANRGEIVIGRLAVSVQLRFELVAHGVCVGFELGAQGVGVGFEFVAQGVQIGLGRLPVEFEMRFGC